MYRLRGSDAQTIYTETPTSPFVTLKVMIYEPVEGKDVPSFDELREFIKKGLQSWCDQGLSMRVVRVPFDIHHPVWVPDPNFTIDDHIHNVALPHPGNNEKLCEFISYILSMPMDQERPLWDSWVVEGLEGGRIAWFCKVHHVHADGMMSANQIVRLHQQSEGDEVTPLPAKGLESPPSKMALISGAIIDLARNYTVELPGFLRILKKSRASGKAEVSVEDSEELPGAFGAPYTFLNNSGGHYRFFDYQTFSLAAFKKVAKSYECTVNTLVLSITSEVLRRYFIELNEPIPDSPLVIVMPVGKKKVDDAKVFLNTEIHNNNVALAFVSLDLRIESFSDRLKTIKRASDLAMQHVKHTDGKRMDNFSDYLPGFLFKFLNRYIARRQRSRQTLLANTAVSNVPGPKEQLFACGGRLKMVELLSCGNLMDINAMGITVWSYMDKLCFNLLYRKDVLPEQHRIKALFSEVYDELAAGV